MNWKDESISDLYSSKNLIELRTKPSKTLIFSPSSPSISFKLYNDNPFPIIFKLKTTQPDIITSQPSRGFIQENSFIECHLTPIKLKYRIFLIVQYAQIINSSDNYLTQWKNLKSNDIYIKNYSCIFEDKKEKLFKPILFTFATITLLTSFIYLRYKSF